MTDHPLGDAAAEYHRLVMAQAEAIRAKDPDRIEETAHELTHFMRLAGQGRLAEWFARPRGED